MSGSARSGRSRAKDPETLKRKLFQDVDVLSTNGNGGLPGHFTSQHVEGAANLCAEPRPMAKTFFAKGAFRSENSNNLSGIYGLSFDRMRYFLCACMFWLSFHFGPPPWYSYHPALLNLRPFDHQVQTHRANNVLSINSLPFKRYLTSGTFVPSYDIILWKSILS